MTKLHYGGQTFKLMEYGPDEKPGDRIDRALAAGRLLIAETRIPAEIILGVTTLANGNELIFSLSGSSPFAVEMERNGS